MFKKKTISEIEKNEIIREYLQDELIRMASNHDPHPEVEPYVSHSIKYLNEQISSRSAMLTQLRNKKSNQ